MSSLNILLGRKIIEWSTFWQVTVVLLLGLLTLVDNARLLVRRVREPDRTAAQVTARQALASAILAISKSSAALEPQMIGAGIFIPRRRGFLWHRRELVRPVRYRLDSHPQPTHIRWLPGKGVVGECWATGRPAHKYKRPIASRWGGKAITPEIWEKKIGENIRAEFTREEFQAIVHKYSEVRAVPIQDDAGRILGVLSVDISMKAPAGRYLGTRDIEELMTSAALIVRDQLPNL